MYHFNTFYIMSYLTKVLHLAIIKQEKKIAFIQGLIIGIGIMLLITILTFGYI